MVIRTVLEVYIHVYIVGCGTVRQSINTIALVSKNLCNKLFILNSFSMLEFCSFHGGPKFYASACSKLKYSRVSEHLVRQSWMKAQVYYKI